MERKVVQDIVPSSRRTIRNVPPKHLHVEEAEDEEVIEEEAPVRRAASKAVPLIRKSPPLAPPISRTSPSRKRKFPNVLVTFIVIFVGIAVIAVALSLLYSKAAVTITPKIAKFEVNGTFTAKKEADSSSLLYDVVTATESMTQSVPATSGPVSEVKAKGTVTLYNEQTVQQKIIAGTRIANDDGQIYRTSATVVIPPGKAGAPGTIVVAVLADGAGASYNMALGSTDKMTIVAYKDTPKYSTVYAKIKTAIAGGYSGTKVTIAAEVQKSAVQSLKDSLAEKLVASAKEKVAKDSVFYPSAYSIEYETPEPVTKTSATADLTVKGTIYAASFKKNSLIKTIAAKELDKFPAPTYDITGLDTLKFSLVNSKDFSAKKGTSAIFSLKGPLTLTGTFSESGLKDELKGTPLKGSNAIFAHYPAIANAYALITPFWMRSFPNSADKIILEIKK